MTGGAVLIKSETVSIVLVTHGEGGVFALGVAQVRGQAPRRATVHSARRGVGGGRSGAGETQGGGRRGTGQAQRRGGETGVRHRRHGWQAAQGLTATEGRASVKQVHLGLYAHTTVRLIKLIILYLFETHLTGPGFENKLIWG